MFVTVVREHHWKPETLDNLFFDNEDIFGLEFWYNDIMKCIDELKKPKT